MRLKCSLLSAWFIQLLYERKAKGTILGITLYFFVFGSELLDETGFVATCMGTHV